MTSQNNVSNRLFADHIATGPRSVHAMLNGYGDGREKRFKRFERRFMKINPDADELDLAKAYAKRCEYPLNRRIYESSCETIGAVLTLAVIAVFSALVTVIFFSSEF